MGELKLGQSREKAKEFLRENRDIALKIEQGIRVAYGLAKPEPAPAPAPEAPKEEEEQKEKEVEHRKKK